MVKASGACQQAMPTRPSLPLSARHELLTSDELSLPAMGASSVFFVAFHRKHVGNCQPRASGGKARLMGVESPELQAGGEAAWNRLAAARNRRSNPANRHWKRSAWQRSARR